MRSCAFFTCHCPTCEKSRFLEKFSLSGSLFHKCCLDLFFRLKNAFALQYRFMMANHLARFGNEETSPRSSRVIRRHPNVMASIARDEAFLLMEYVMHHPGTYLREAVHYLENSCGRELSLSSVRRCLARRDFTRKKVRQR